MFSEWGLTGWEWPTTSRVGWGVAIFTATFLISLTVTVILVIRIPATYFLDRPADASRPLPVRWGPLRILKNLLAALVILAGVVMLITPGQGVLTILIGIMLLDFPGKRKWERRLIRRPAINRAVNRIRARFGKPPLELES